MAGFYIDIGVSALLASGAIGLRSGRSVARILPHGVELDDGSVLEADEIVIATGYGNMVTTAAKILGPEAVAGVADVWGVDENTGEIKGMWRNVGGERGLWFMGGNLALTRWYSRTLALGIAAIEGGLA